VDTTFFLQDGARPYTAYVLDGVHDVFGSRVLSDRFPKRFLGPTQPPTQWVPKGLTPGVKLPEREADYSPSSSTEVLYVRSDTSLWRDV
jgi:hypothetical protein